MEVEPWYGGETREVAGSPETCGGDQSGCHPVGMRWVWGRDPQGEDEPQAGLSTPVAPMPLHILPWGVRRWRTAVPFEKARAPLGRATQRQGSDVAMARTTPVLLGLCSLVALMADGVIARHTMPVCTAAWDTKARPTFADALALTRRCLWSHCHCSTSSHRREVVKVPRSLWERLTDAVWYAA